MINRLDQIIGSTCIKTSLAVLFLSPRSQGDHREVIKSPVSSQAPHRFIAVHFRHHNIHQNKIWYGFFGQIQGLFAINGNVDLETFFPENSPYDLNILLKVMIVISTMTYVKILTKMAK